METADILTMILFGLIVAACWVVVPGLIAGWLLRESGRSFRSGFALGAVFGPLGVLAALVFVSVADCRGSRTSSRRRGSRTHYDVPLLGRLHASTAWTLAGLATFMCVWVLGGIGYEVFYHRPRGDEGQRASAVAPGAAAPTAALPGGAQAGGDSSETKTTDAAVKNDAETQPRPSMFGALTSQGTQPGQLSAAASPSATQPVQAASLEGVELTGVAPSPLPTASSHANTAANAGNVAAAPPKAPAAPSRAAIVSEVTSTLAARGYRAHAAVSGDARTSTLSISCATLTRAAGSQLLGNSRTREALKAAGIRIVVMINGQESWTYML